MGDAHIQSVRFVHHDLSYENYDHIVLKIETETSRTWVKGHLKRRKTGHASSEVVYFKSTYMKFDHAFYINDTSFQIGHAIAF